jgi:hypothetical protein
MILNKLYRSIPLALMFASVFLFVGILSPLSWSANIVTQVVVTGIVLGVVCAYCVTTYIDDHFV